MHRAAMSEIFGKISIDEGDRDRQPFQRANIVEQQHASQHDRKRAACGQCQMQRAAVIRRKILSAIFLPQFIRRLRRHVQLLRLIAVLIATVGSVTRAVLHIARLGHSEPWIWRSSPDQ